MGLAKRREHTRSETFLSGVDAILVSHSPDVRYLSGFTGSAGILVLTADRTLLFTDGRYRDQAKAEVRGVEIVIADRSTLLAACDWIGQTAIQRCAVDASHTTLSAMEAMRRALPARGRRKLFFPTEACVARQRERKDPSEMVAIRSAAALACQLFDKLLNYITPGRSELEIAAKLEYEARIAGAEAMSFETIVASGRRSALPHGRATMTRLPRRGFVTLDFGVVVSGYCSDMTRTVYLGRPSARERDVYHSVLEAQIAAADAVRPKVAAGDIDKVAREVLRRAGLDMFFTHSTGHGVGLEIHEGPRLGKGQRQLLEPGMVITIEPGVYVPESFGVRIEDMVLVTKTGREVLTQSTKALIEL